MSELRFAKCYSFRAGDLVMDGLNRYLVLYGLRMLRKSEPNVFFGGFPETYAVLFQTNENLTYWETTVNSRPVMSKHHKIGNVFEDNTQEVIEFLLGMSSSELKTFNNHMKCAKMSEWRRAFPENCPA